MAFWNRKKVETQPSPRYGQRAFNASAYAPTLDLGETISLNQDIRGGLAGIRRRARNMVQNNGHARTIINSLKANVIGPDGIKLTCQAKNSRTGALDTKGNTLVETEWKNWGKYGNCDVTGQMDWVKLQNIILQTVITDGEALIYIRRGEEYGKWNFQLELLDIAQLDENFFWVTTEGNIVFQGVELDDRGRHVAYWIWEKNMQDPMIYANHSNRRLRIPASDIIHLYDQESPKQVRAVSWLASALLNIHHLELLQNSELVMSRLQTLKSVVFSIDKPDEFSVGDEELDAYGMINRDLTPGQVSILPPGITPTPIEWDVQHTGIETLTKTILRNVAGAMGLNYNSIASDLESVSYSSARLGSLETRANFVSRQKWFITNCVNRVYEKWLDVQFMTGNIPFPHDRFEKFCDVKWTGKGFQSIDPAKEAASNAAALLMGTKTRSEICAEQGRDFEEILAETIAEEQLRIAAYAAAGIELPPNNPLLVPLAVAEEKAESTETEDTAEEE